MSLMLLDYGKHNPYGEIVGKERHIAWPVNAYRVTLPMIQKDSELLNPFEQVILKLIDAGGPTEAELLAAETCMPPDLVKCVLLRLRDEAYIDEYNRIIIEKRDNWSPDQESRQSIVTAVLFRELSSGRILPFLHMLNSDNPLRLKENNGQTKRHIRSDHTQVMKHPGARDVISALRGMLKRSKAFGKETLLPSVRQITIATPPEPYLLDCSIAILKSDGEFRIADPFGNGFSLVLESAFRRLLERDDDLGRWMTDWRKSLSNPVQESRIPLKKEPYDNDINRDRYPELISSLNKHINLSPHRSIEQLHGINEWALFYACVERSYDPAIRKLKLTSQSEHPIILRNAADKLSLTLPPQGLFAIREGKINNFLKGKAELETVLSLSLLIAEADSNHPLRRIASVYPDFIERLINIKKKRDESAHGANGVRRKDVELSDEPFTRDVVRCLLRGITFDESIEDESTEEESVREYAADLLLDARTGIQGEFGYERYNQMGINLQDRLIDAERFWLRCRDDDDSLVFVCNLYAALQIAFRRILYGAMPPDIAESDYLTTAERIAAEHGFGDLPECLRTSKRIAIRETLLGNDQTLQSCLIAFLLVSDSEVLSAISEVHPSFIADVARLIDLRGHGNESIPLKREMVRDLRRAVYTIISTLQEY